jgi:hypothetical protein
MVWTIPNSACPSSVEFATYRSICGHPTAARGAWECGCHLSNNRRPSRCLESMPVCRSPQFALRLAAHLHRKLARMLAFSGQLRRICGAPWRYLAGRHQIAAERVCRSRLNGAPAVILGKDRQAPARVHSQPLPSRPGEFHPEPLTDPDLSLSTHPARATARRLPPSVERRARPGEPVGPNQRR